MKLLIASLLLCAIMAPTRTAADTCYASCQDGWTGHSGRCFLYVSTPMTWADAEKHCQTHGGNLASVHNLNEHQEIQSMILRVTQSYPLTWLGGTDAQQEGTWLWSNGSPFQYDHWSHGQPDNRASAHCLLMNFGDDRKFDDQPCNYKKPFVCAVKP